MPAINQQTQIVITPERFLNACSASELIELQILLNSPRYQEKMDSDASDQPAANEEMSIKKHLGNEA